MNIILETERLRIREFLLQDTAFIIELLNSPGWLQYIGDRQVLTHEQAITYLQNGPLKSYAQNGFGLWMVELKDDQTPIAMCGIICRDFLAHPDIGFALLPSFMGQGYAYEMASAVLAHAINKLGLTKLCAIVLAENEHSIKLLNKLHFHPHSTIVYPGTEDELLLYMN